MLVIFIFFFNLTLISHFLSMPLQNSFDMVTKEKFIAKYNEILASAFISNLIYEIQVSD